MARTRSQTPKLPKLPTPKPPKSPLQQLPGIKPLRGISRPAGVRPPAGLKSPKGLEPFPGDPSSSPGRRDEGVGADDPVIVRRIQDALSTRRPISATYSGKLRELTPLALGVLDGGFRLWAYQFGGDSDYKCKCFIVAKLGDVELGYGKLPMPDNDPGPLSCMEEQGIQYLSDV